LCLAGGDVLAHCFDFDGEVCVYGCVEVADGDHAYEFVVAIFVVGDGDVSDFAVAHEVACFGEGGFEGAVDDIFGHGVGDGCYCGVELCGDDSCEDVAFCDDACDFVEGVGDDEGADAVFVHGACGFEGGGGLGDGVDAFDSVVAVIAFVPVFFVCEELCDSIHDRFLPVSISGLPSQRGVKIGWRMGLWSGPMI